MKLAIVPGSFDPMTMGHLEIVKAALKKYDRVVVAVMNNRDKQYYFSPEERVAIAKKTIAHLSKAEVLFDEGMLVDLYDRLGAVAVCKGWRNEKDLVYEREMAAWNLSHNPRFVTELIQTKADFASVSSTEVRRRLSMGEELFDMIHPDAIALVEQKRIKNESI